MEDCYIISTTNIVRDGILAEGIVLNNAAMGHRFFTYEELYYLIELIQSTIAVYPELGYNTDEDIVAENQRRDEAFKDWIVAHKRPETKRGPKKDHLYIIRDLDFNALKIGRSINPESRLKGLATSAANHMELVKTFPEMGRMEEAAHEALKAAGHHIRSEWFKDDPQVFQIIENLVSASA